MTRFHTFRRLTLVLLAVVFLDCQTIDTEAEKAEIEKVIHTSIGWALDKDLNLLYSVLAQDENFFIFHPDSSSTIVGFEAFRNHAETVFLNPAFKATHFETRNMHITLSESGDVAWYACNLDDLGEWNGHPTGWYNVRWTGVVEKRNGRWVLMQMHFSFPTDRG